MKSLDRQLVLTDSIMTDTTKLFSTTDCDGLVATIDIVSEYVVLDLIDQDIPINQLQTKGVSGRLNFNSSTFVNFVNTEKSCGNGIFFESREDTKVSGRSCVLITNTPTIFPEDKAFKFDIISLDTVEGKDRLRLGDASTGDGSSDANRPTALSLLEHFRESF